jgi:hypothetical protein
MKLFKVYAALSSDIRNAEVWSYFETTNNLVKITNKNNNKFIIVRNREIDKNFEKIYNKVGGGRILISKNKNPIVLSEFQRKKLAIKNTQSTENLSFNNTNFINEYCHYFINHPDDVVRIVYKITLFSFITNLLLALLSGIISICIK